MKKLFLIAFTLVMLSAMVVPAAASPAKYIEVVLSDTPTEVKSGERITLTAITPKQGSDFTDEWIGATKISTVLTQDGYYVSTAEVTVQDSLTVIYKISMTSGNSGTRFIGQASETVSVAQTRTITGVEVKNITLEQTLFSTTIYGGDVYLVWSDSTRTYYGKTYFACSNNIASKSIVIPVSIDGNEYMFDVEVAPSI